MAYGYNKVKGLNALIAIVSTPIVRAIRVRFPNPFIQVGNRR